ncbi:pectate lyase [Shouchella patagoniensis]|uniref:pectate lyase n=1 Tax=Shouchella patagoniensis TaxID=228576 RepID=UPI000994A1AF|nr:pectate lyase [Shouchella patagoniensis]
MKALHFLPSFATLLVASSLFVLSPTEQTAKASVVTEADHLLTWQMEHGGWTKDMPEIYTRDWNGNESRSVWTSNGQELGTIDNDATVSEILVVAEAYQETGDLRYKESVYSGIDFLFKLQYPSGGFRQVYPQRGSDPSSSVWYSNYVTFNDHAMINVLRLLEDAKEGIQPFHGDLIDENLASAIEDSIDDGLGFILDSQIDANGTKTAWGQQHDPVTLAPQQGRIYEHPSIATDESVGIVQWLEDQPNQSAAVQDAVASARAWMEDARVPNTRYERRIEPHFFSDQGAETWYRFYEIGTNRPIFSGRDGIIHHDIMNVEQERRYGYAWAGSWPTRLR